MADQKTGIPTATSKVACAHAEGDRKERFNIDQQRVEIICGKCGEYLKSRDAGFIPVVK